MRTLDPSGGLPHPLLALFCSNRCPGNLVLQFYELARSLRDQRIATMGGFHTPMEKEALDFLLRGNQPVIWVPAWTRTPRGLTPSQREAVNQRGLRLLNIFDPPLRRASRHSSERRNRWIIEQADAVLVVHANPNGLTERATQLALELKKPTWALCDPANGHLRGLLPPGGMAGVESIIAEVLALGRGVRP